jgi:hypothetical protein
MGAITALPLRATTNTALRPQVLTSAEMLSMLWVVSLVCCDAVNW